MNIRLGRRSRSAFSIALITVQFAVSFSAIAYHNLGPSGWQNVSAGLFQQTAFLAPNNLMPGDDMGGSVAISGNTAIVAAKYTQVNGQNFHGVVYIFIRQPDNTWVQQQELIVPTSNLNFGYSVAIDGNVAVIGNSAQGNGQDQGRAYIFTRKGTTWTQTETLTGVGGNNLFGQSVAISKNTIAVGDPGVGVFVFTPVGNLWALEQQLTESNTAGDFFPGRMALDGDTLIAAAARATSAFVFVRNGSTWILQQQLSGSDSVPGDSFGSAVAIRGDTAVVGAHLADINGFVDAGAAYVFHRTGSTWIQQQKLVASDAKADRNFGDSVDTSSSVIVVGTSRDRLLGPDPPKGAVYIYTGNLAGTWSERQKITGHEDTVNFGAAAALDGMRLVVGAPLDRNGGPSDVVGPGAAYVFEMLDSDGDGIPDDWEQNGVAINGRFIDLPAMGADPMHKDIFVQADWMAPDPSRPGSQIKPDPRAIKVVVDSFLQAPVGNPDNRMGIALHVDFGPDSIMNPRTGAKWGSLSRAREIPFQQIIGSGEAAQYNWSDVDAVKTVDFVPSGRPSVFHYALFANQFNEKQNGGISRGIGASDFIVTLGSWDPPGGVFSAQAGTFMHELGHNLGLHHGGDDDINNKPNYLSLMNYSFGLTGLLRTNGLPDYDYSRVEFATLDETNLAENMGIHDDGTYFTLWNKYTRSTSPAGSNQCVNNPNGYFSFFYPSQTLDWNCDGTATVGVIQADINGDGVCVGAGPSHQLQTTPAGDDEIRTKPSGESFIVSGPNRTCDTAATGTDVQENTVGFVQPNLLKGFNDWPVIVFDGGGIIGSGAANPSPEPTTKVDEPTREQLLDVTPPGLLDAENNAPRDVVTVSNHLGTPPFTVEFDGSGSTAAAGTIVSYSWDFGDGTTGSGATVSHTYNTLGDYFVTLTVTDSSGKVNLIRLRTYVGVVTSLPTPTPFPTPSPTPTPTVTPTPTPTPGPGDVDHSFEAAVTQNIRGVKTLAFQQDGKLVVGGAFESFGGAPMRAIARVNLDGSPDPTFRPGLAVPYQRTATQVSSVAIQSDGKILVGIAYSSNSSLTDSPLLVRLNPNGSLDSSFHPSLARTFDESVNAIRVAPDGKILIGGNFAYRAGTLPQQFNVARLNSDGTFDTSFVLANGNPRPQTVNCIALQADGRILIGGSFSGQSPFLPRSALARLNADGSLDPSFDTEIVPVTASVVRALALQSDGKIVAAGIFDLDNTNSHNEAIVRFNANGTRDSSFIDVFPPGTGNAIAEVDAMVLQSDGKLVIGGAFDISGNAPRICLARLNSNGSVDTSFSPNNDSGTATDNIVNALALRITGPGVGKIIVGGDNMLYGHQPAEGVVQLNADGSRDMTFASEGPGLSGRVLALTAQTDGKFLIGFIGPSSIGRLTRVDQTLTQAIARVNPDGTIDPTFASPMVPSSSSNFVRMIALQGDGKILASGSFLLPGQTENSVFCRLNVDGAVDSTFVPAAAAGGGPVAIQSDGKIITNGFTSVPALVRLNTNGTKDPTFQGSFDSNGVPEVIVIQLDGKVVVGGHFIRACDTNGCLPRSNIARFNTDGTVDTTFDPGQGASDEVIAIALQPDGKIVIGGKFLSYDGTPQPAIGRLNSNGKLDSTFTPNNPNVDDFGNARPVQSIIVQAIGKIVFATSRRGVNVPNQVVRLNGDGTLDPGFTRGSGADADINALALGSDQRIIAGGDFSVLNSSASLGLAALLSGPPTTARLTNISTRSFVQTGDRMMIGGFIITGTGSKQILLRALGPTLGQSPFNVPEVLNDPIVELHDGTGAIIASNDNWQNDPNATSIPVALRPPNIRESALLTTLTPGAYTAIVKGTSNSTGVALVEIYDLDSGLSSCKLSNISTRSFVQTGDNVMIAGAIVQGSGGQPVLVRALGPTLGQFNVPSVLPDPFLELHDANGALVQSNDNWKDTQQAEILETTKAPPNNVESAILINLGIGNYTAIVRGNGNSSGNALVEVYTLP